MILAKTLRINSHNNPVLSSASITWPLPWAIWAAVDYPVALPEHALNRCCNVTLTVSSHPVSD